MIPPETVTATMTVTDGTWHHVAATFDELLSDRILVEAPRTTLEKPRTP